MVTGICRRVDRTEIYELLSISAKQAKLSIRTVTRFRGSLNERPFVVVVFADRPFGKLSIGFPHEAATCSGVGCRGAMTDKDMVTESCGTESLKYENF